MKTIFGRSYRPRNKVTRGRKPQEPVKTVEAPSYDLTIFKLKWRNLRANYKIEPSRRIMPSEGMA